MILKFQNGGTNNASGAIPPLVSYMPVTISDLLQLSLLILPNYTTKDEKAVDLADKDILQLLEKLDGLPSDIAQITNGLLNFYFDKSFSGLIGNLSSIESRYLLTISLMKIANFNKKEYDNAFNIVTKNGGYNEAAIDSNGFILCTNDKGDYVKLTPEEYLKLKKYRYLTNSEILELRAYNPEVAFLNDLTYIAKLGIGMNSINEYILNIISGLGSDNISTSGYTSVLNGKILKGISIILDALSKGAIDKNYDSLSVDGLYKNNLVTKDLTKQIEAALNYIYSTLPDNAKSLLKLKAGNNNTTLEGLLLSFVGSRSNTYKSFLSLLLQDVNSDGTKKQSSKDGKSGKDNSPEINNPTAFLTDNGVNSKLTFKTESGFELDVNATMLPATDKSGNNIGITTLENFANTSTLSPLFDYNHITIGDKVADMSAVLNILVNSNQVYKAYLPIDRERAAKGIITPDLDILETLSLIDEDIKESGAKTPEEINKIYASYSLPGFLNSDGTINENYYKPFGIMNSSVLSDALPEGSNVDLENDKYFLLITDKNEVNNTWKMLKGLNTKETIDDKGWFDSFSQFLGGSGSYQAIYKSLVFLPIVSTNPILGTYGGGDTPTLDQLRNYELLVLQELRISNFKPLGLLEL